MKGFLERLQWKLSGMMQGRRGADTFSNFLVVAGIVLLFASLIPGLDLLSWVALIVLAVLTKQGKTGKLLPETADRLPTFFVRFFCNFFNNSFIISFFLLPL